MLNEITSTADKSALANRWQSTRDSIFSEMTRLAVEHKAINLGQGAPDFYGPKKILDSICTHMQTCHNQYSPAAGEHALCEQIASFIFEHTGVSYDPTTEITITCGASEALFCTLNAYLSPGDNVILFEPAYDLYGQAITNTGANILSVPLIPPTLDSDTNESSEWTIDWKAFESAVAQGFKCIIINTPHNPTGKIFTAEELTKIGKSVLEHNAILITDEVYENLSFVKSRPYISAAGLPKLKEYTVRISSSAKLFGFTGLKIGWATAPAKLTKGIQLVHQSTVFCVNPAIQLGLAECLSDKKWLGEYLASQREAYSKKHEILSKTLKDHGFLLSSCDGTFFLCANYKNISDEKDSLVFAKKFLETHKIATIPLASFYTDPPEECTWVRFAFCKSDETLQKVEDNLKQYGKI